MKKGRKKRKLNKLKLFVTILIIVIIIFAIRLLFLRKNNTEDLGTEVVSQNTIEVSDNEAPEITLNGKEKVIVAVGGKYKEENVIAKDNIDGDISDKVIIKGSVDTSKAGTYEITYEAKDEAGNSSNAKREVKVCHSLGNNGLPVLMYHFFYEKSKSKPQDNNWMEISNFEEQIKYLAENDFYFPTWQEVEDFIDGKTILPEKSVVITVDDGDPSFFELAVPVLQKYNIDATSFVITSWYGARANDKQKNVSYQSHSDSMHVSGGNGKGVMLSWSYDKLVQDLETSKSILGGDATIFCYPFGQYNDTDIRALKTAGYKLAFTTKGGRVYKGSSKYELSRVRIMGTTTLSEFKNMVK